MDTPRHMVEQIIKFSDGTQTVIKYRGVIKDGVLTPDAVEETSTAEEGEKTLAETLSEE